MSKIHYSLPPELGEWASEHPGAAAGMGLCLICLMNAKGEQVTATRDIWQPASLDGMPSGIKWVPFDAPKLNSPIREAVCVGICDMFPGQLMPLCWDHLGAIAPADPLPLCKWCGGTGRKEAPGIQGATVIPPGLGGNGSHKRGHG